MENVSGKVVYTKKINIKNVVIIIMILIGVYTASQVTNLVGVLTGEATTDGRRVLNEAPSWSGTSTKVKLAETEVEVWVPDVVMLNFDSEKTEQTFELGNPAQNDMKMSIDLIIDDIKLFRSGILRPGHGVTGANINACFQPSSYKAVVIYTFYKRSGIKLKEFDLIKREITIQAEGSGEKYKEGVNKFKKKSE